VPLDLAPKWSITFLSQSPTHRESVPGASPFTKSILPMVHHDLANDCKRLITGQRADRSRIVVASSKDRTPAGVTDFCPSLCVAAESHRPPLCVTYDNPLTEFANECRLNRQGSAARKRRMVSWASS
jgi:hypothetical protein